MNSLDIRVGILGLGEIGKALCSLYRDKGIKVYKKDLIKTDVGFKDLHVLNICLPYTDDFVSTVSEQINKTTPQLVIIHSTTPVGTTRKIANLHQCSIVHSPVIGSHPFIKKSLKTFVKFIGSDNNKATTLIRKHFKLLGLKCRVLGNYETTELAKLLCTTYYGLCIAWHGYMDHTCEKYNVDFNTLAHWNKNYNNGYNKLKLSKYTRPILTPPVNGIGGHCVIPNAALLNKIAPSILIQEILKYGK